MSKNIFKTIYSPPDKIVSVSGEKDRLNFKPSPIDGDSYELLPDGKIHSYDEIQSHANECDFEKVIDMYQKTGDESLLHRRAAFFDEAGVMPSDYRALRQQIAKADELFKGLPADIRSEYGNSPATFYSNPSNLAIVESYFNQKASVPQSTEKPVTPSKASASEVKIDVSEVKTDV